MEWSLHALWLLAKDTDKTMGYLVLTGLALTSLQIPEGGIHNETRDRHHFPLKREYAVETVKLEIKEKIATITINRPEKLNALN